MSDLPEEAKQIALKMQAIKDMIHDGGIITKTTELRREFEQLKIPLRTAAPGAKNLLNDDEYYLPFKDFCWQSGGKLTEERGIAGDGYSPWHRLACEFDDEKQKLVVDLSQTENKKEYHFQNFTGGQTLHTIRDDDMVQASLLGEPADRAFIVRNFKYPVTQTHQVTGEFKNVDLLVHKGSYEKMYSLDLR